MTHIAFADDMPLMARSWTSLRRMLTSLRRALAARGLSLHPAKCKAQTNDSSWGRRGSIAVEGDFSIEIVPEGHGLKFLGTVLSLEDTMRAELQNGITAGWRMFW